MDREKLPDALYFSVFDMKRGKSEERRLHIIQATIDCIATLGFDATTFDEIGKRVKMKRTHVNYYFTTREELLITSVRYAIALGQHALNKHLQNAIGWRERLIAVIESPFEWLQQYPKHASVMTAFYHLCISNASYRAVQSAIRQGGEDRLVACLQTPVENGKVAKKKARELARTFQSLITGTLLNQCTTDYPVDLPALKKSVVHHSLLLLDAELSR